MDEVGIPSGKAGGIARLPLVIGLMTFAVTAVCAVLSSGSGATRAPIEFGFLLIAVFVFLSARRSVLVGAFSGLVVLHFVVGPLLLAHVDPGYDPSPPWIVIEWLGSVVAGASVVRAVVDPKRSKPSIGVSVVHWWIVCGVVVVQALLALTGKAGYSAQLSTGVSTPTGVSGTLSAVAPAFVLALFAVHFATGGRMTARIVALACTEVLVLISTGFRGAGINFVIEAAVLYAVVVRPRVTRVGIFRGLAIVVAAIAVGVVVFNAAAGVKSRAATAQGATSSGTQLWSTGHISESLGTRLDLLTATETGVAAAARGPLAGLGWGPQFAAAVPRAIWAGKPTVTYGNDVARNVFGLQSDKTSSTIGTLGDVWINAGLAGVLGVGALIGAALVSVEDRIRSGRASSIALVFVGIAAIEVTNVEIPFGLIVVDIIRTGLLVGLAWVLADLTAISSATAKDRRLTVRRGRGFVR